MRPCSIASVLSLVAIGCLDPLVDDDPTYSPDVRPAGNEIAWATDDPVVAARVSAADGIATNPVVRRAGFVAGTAVMFWDFGAAPRTTAPMWIFRRCADDGGAPLPGDMGSVGHPDVIESIPGDAAYTPFRSLWLVCVTDRYAGEQIVSRRGLDDAIALGLVEAPVALETFGAYPMTLPDVSLELGGAAPNAQPFAAYYDGARAAMFHPGGDPAGVYPLTSSLLKAGRVHRLVKADDDAFEQVVFSVARSTVDGPNPAYVPLWVVTEVTMAETYVAGSATSEAELFTVAGTTLTAVHPEIVEFETTTTMVYWEIQLAEGAP